MSSMPRTLDGDVLVQHLSADARTIDRALLTRTGRTARTLVKDGPLRLVLMAVAPGAAIPAHHADGPVTIQVLEGAVRFTALGREYPLVAGDVLVLAPGVEHVGHSSAGALFLLTIVHAVPAADVSDERDGALAESARRRWQDDGGRQPDIGTATTDRRLP